MFEGEDAPVQRMQREMNRIFDDFQRSFLQMTPFATHPASMCNMELPRVDIRETKKRIEVTADVPGLSEKQIQLTLSPDGDALHLRGEREHETDSAEDSGLRRSER